MEGTYDLNSATLVLELNENFNRFKFSSKINILELLKSSNLILRNTELALGDYSISASKLNFDFERRTLETYITKFLIPNENTSVFPNKFKVYAVFPFKESIISKIDILGENSSNLKASLEIVEPINGLDSEHASFDFL